MFWPVWELNRNHLYKWNIICLLNYTKFHNTYNDPASILEITPLNFTGGLENSLSVSDTKKNYSGQKSKFRPQKGPEFPQNDKNPKLFGTNNTLVQKKIVPHR